MHFILNLVAVFLFLMSRFLDLLKDMLMYIFFKVVWFDVFWYDMYKWICCLWRDSISKADSLGSVSDRSPSFGLLNGSPKPSCFRPFAAGERRSWTA